MLSLEGLRPPPPENDYPLISDEQVCIALGAKIDDIVSNIMKPVRLISSPPKLLYNIEGGTDISKFCDDKGNVLGEVEHDRLQRLNIEVMITYGFDSEHSHLISHQKRGEFVTIDRHLFPSQSIPELAFERIWAYMTKTKEPVRISWRVVDNAPDIKLSVLSWLMHI